ncbi:MAG TPA: glycosyltransferase, partial [candidate division Zixibacteria bacterium]|nr:glycosyltransferase [candidate division Zixibacteria bacterium]
MSVLVPVFNEERTIGEILTRLRSLPVALQIVVVDNGSTDKTYLEAQEFADRGEITLIRHTATRGK